MTQLQINRLVQVVRTLLSWAVALLVGCPQVRSPLAHPLLRPGGQLLAWKGQRREAQAELDALDARPGEGWSDAHIEDLHVPGLAAGRCLVRLVRG